MSNQESEWYHGELIPKIPEKNFTNGGQIPAYGNEKTSDQIIQELREENAKLKEENNILRSQLEHFASIPRDVINSFPGTTAQKMQVDAITVLAKLRYLQQEGGEQ